jgi:tRNA1(Val) A37 N6-methylase TrmN6
MNASEVAKHLQSISENQAVQDFQKLKNDVTVKDSLRVGSKAMNYFFKEHMLHTKSSRFGKSFLEMLESDDFQKPYYQKVIQYNLDKKHNEIMSKYQAFQIYCGSICAFKPIVARNLYAKLDSKAVLDPCAGWGGRCLGAMSLGIPYYGWDTNKSLESAYDGMVALYPSRGEVKMHYEDSSQADFSTYKYDTVFTSPPYYVKSQCREVYPGMPQYASENEFSETFLKPVLKNAWTHLKLGGHLALNVPTDMLPLLESWFGKPTSEYPLFLKKRKGDTNGAKYKESIYVWKKA